MEGVFGVTKRRYGLKRILTRLPSTSATTIAMVMIILNLEKIILRLFLTDRHWFTDWNGITMRWRLEAMEIHHQLKTHLRTGGGGVAPLPKYGLLRVIQRTLFIAVMCLRQPGHW